jgi:hypothetical protein
MHRSEGAKVPADRRPQLVIGEKSGFRLHLDFK